MLLFAGCEQPSYDFYTNMPVGTYEIADAHFTAHNIGGYTAADRNFEEVDTSAFDSVGRLYFSMTTDAELVVSADFSTDAAVANFTAFTTAVKYKLDAIDKALSTSVDNSDISKFNAASAGEKLEITQISYEVLGTALKVYNETDGCYNPALYYNIQAYGFGGAKSIPKTAAELPKDEVIAKYTELACHFGEIELSNEGGKYFVTKPSQTVEIDGVTYAMKLDLGGIGKGYAVDCVDALYDAYGYNYGYFNFGSSSIVMKSNYLQGAYNLGFSSPRSPARDPYITTTIRNEKLSTSGDNEQRYFIDGVRYCHIIDPATGKPVQTGIMSATVLGGSAAEDDAYTTAIMCMGKEKAIEFIEEKLTGRRVVFTVQ